MRCETCLLEQPEAATAALPTLVQRLERCDECPHLAGPGRVLVERLREAATSARRTANSARKAESERAELEREVERYESRIAKLEALQKVAVLEADADLRAKAEQLARKQAELLEVSTPVLAVWDGLVVAPMIGRVDAARARHLQEGLLAAVRERRARQAIVDLTGVREVDLETADSLLQISRAVRLLGAEVVLTGLHAALAHTFVELGADLSAVRTMQSLRDALRAFLARPRR